MEDGNLFAFRTNEKTGRNASDAIIILDSDDDPGNASSFFPLKGSYSSSSRDGSVALVRTSSPISSVLRRSPSLGKFELAISAKTSPSDVSSSTLGVCSDIVIEQALPSGHYTTFQEATRGLVKTLPSPMASPIYVDVDLSSDMDCNNSPTGDEHKKLTVAKMPYLQPNDEPINPIVIDSSTVVSDALPPPTSARQGTQLQSHNLPGLLEKVFAVDFEETSSDAESQQDTSSDDDQPFPLDKGVAIHVRKLLPGPAHRADLHESDSDGFNTSAIDHDVELPFSSTRCRSSPPISLTRRPLSSRKRTEQYSESSDDDNLMERCASSPNRFEESAPRRVTVNGTINGTPLAIDRTEASSTSLPKAANGKARRILVPETVGLPLATISMRADANFLDCNKTH
jgi:hypothetical protein